MTKQKFIAPAAALLATILAGPAPAHHSSAMFDMTRTISVKGTVSEWRWSNPHAWLVLVANDGAGPPTTWNIEFTSPNNLVHQGWKRTTLKAGDPVTISIHPLRDNKSGGTYTSIVLPDGTTLGNPS